MAYRGHFRNGVIVFDEPVDMPEGSEVTIEPVDFGTLEERLHDIIGTIPGLPADLAENHDHYAHGKPIP